MILLWKQSLWVGRSIGTLLFYVRTGESLKWEKSFLVSAQVQQIGYTWASKSLWNVLGCGAGCPPSSQPAYQCMSPCIHMLLCHMLMLDKRWLRLHFLKIAFHLPPIALNREKTVKGSRMTPYLLTSCVKEQRSGVLWGRCLTWGADTIFFCAFF